MRILSFRAFCQIDQKSYRAAYDSLIVAQAFNKEILIEKMSKFTADLEAAEEMIHKYLQKHNNSWHSKPLSELEGDILYLKRIDWILTYHCALCEYMQRDFVHAQEVKISEFSHSMMLLLTFTPLSHPTFFPLFVV